MDEQFVVDIENQRLVGTDFSIRADSIYAKGDLWIALVGVRAGLNLLVSPPDDEIEGIAAPPQLRAGDWADKPMIEAWASQPDDSDGIAVLGRDGVPERIANIPLCGCGERGCGNSGAQLDKRIWAGELPVVIDELRYLPWAASVDDLPVLNGGLLGQLDTEERDREFAAIRRWSAKDKPTVTRRRQQQASRPRFSAVSSDDPRYARARAERLFRAEALSLAAAGRLPPRAVGEAGSAEA